MCARSISFYKMLVLSQQVPCSALEREPCSALTICQHSCLQDVQGAFSLPERMPMETEVIC